ncbi:MAG: polyprenyl synthetase family protein [Rhodospirillales bacterium]|nr:polyprenyl synthetase family protein [Rhodospirillales bacterium]MBO6786347.1 polyprenyl synthetase family protein [Rhodospirillales bacterium]
MSDLASALTACAETVEKCLDRLLPHTETPEARVIDAMRYATLGGGKRIRPFLLVESAKLFGVAESCAYRAASALEMVHCYSLVHDDLPAMDDDDMRRGRPTVHKEYDEATAILAGDALLTKSFEVLAHPDTHENAGVRANLCLALATASGDHGMVGGQMLDLVAEQSELDIPEITRLQRMKTGALIAVACDMGAIMGRATGAARQALHHYAHDIGLAFQIADDLLDVEGDADEVGKRTGKDEAAGKATFVSLLGVERAREQAHLLAGQAAAHLEMFEEKGEHLKELADFIVTRRK